jgi:hypothetical protein
LAVEPEGKTLVGRMDNIKFCLGEIVWDGMDWNGLTHDGYQWRALVNAAVDIRIP